MSNKNKTIFQDLPKLILIVSLVIGISAVLGVTFFMIKNKPIREYGLKIITAPVPAPEIKKDTSDWKTYRNEEYGFEFKYPQDLSENTPESADAIFEATKKDDYALYYFTISIRKGYKADDILSATKDAKEIYAGKSIGYKYFYTEGVGASGVALIQSGQDVISITFDYIGNDPKFTAENSKMSFVQNYFDKIVNTFKFTEEKDEIADWNVYSNPEVDFTFKYPKDWEIKQDYFYTWPDGTVSDKRTVVLRRTGDDASNDWININMRQFQCDWGICKDVLGNTIGTYSEDENVLKISENIVKTFGIKTEKIAGKWEDFSFQFEDTSGILSNNKIYFDTRIYIINDKTGEKNIFIDSTKKEYNTAFSAGGFPKTSDNEIYKINNKLYFRPYNPGVAPGLNEIWELSLDGKSLKKMNINDILKPFDQEHWSEDGKQIIIIPSSESGDVKKMYIADLINDEYKLILELEGDETFSPNKDDIGIGIGVSDVEWKNDVIKYAVYSQKKKEEIEIADYDPIDKNYLNKIIIEYREIKTN